MRHKTVWLGPLLSALAALLLLYWLFQHFGLTLPDFWQKKPPAEDERQHYYLQLTRTADGQDAPQTTEIDLEEAVVGFVAAEMPAAYGEEALAAQAVAARTYAWQKYRSTGEICDDSTHCLAYLDEAGRRKRFGGAFGEYENKLRQASENTYGLVLAKDGQIVPAYFHACCGGQTETSAACWGGSSYYPAAACYWDTNCPVSGSFWPKEQLAERLEVPVSQLALLYIAQNTPSGRVKEVRCGSQRWTGSDFRQLLSLPSANFAWLEAKEGFWFTSLGRGHGVGLCQQGAGGLAAQGYSWRQILAVYYAGCDIVSIEDLADSDA